MECEVPVQPVHLNQGMTVENLINGRFSRNPRLAWALFHWGYIPEPLAWRP